MFMKLRATNKSIKNKVSVSILVDYVKRVVILSEINLYKFKLIPKRQMKELRN